MTTEEHESTPSDLADELARRRDTVADSLRANLVASGRPFYSTADEQGRVVFRDSLTDEEWRPEAVRAWRASRGSQDTNDGAEG